MSSADASAPATEGVRDEEAASSAATPQPAVRSSPAPGDSGRAETPEPPAGGGGSQAALPAPRPTLADARAALDRRDYAVAKDLFEALGRKDAAEAIDGALAALDRKDYPAAHAFFETLAAKASDDVPAAEARPEPAPPPPPAILPVDPPTIDLDAVRVASPPARPARRRSRLAPVVAVLALLALVGAGFVFARSGLLAGFGPQSIGALFKSSAQPPAPGAGVADEDRAAGGDLRAALAETNARLDRVERDFGARLDTLGERLKQGANAAPADLLARLDALDKAVAEKAGASPPAADLAALAARLDRLEKKAAAPAGAPAPDLAARLDKVEKKLAAASAAKPAAPAAAKPAAAPGGPPPTAGNEPGGPPRLLPDYSVEAVQGGVALVESRYGPQQVAPGDVIPGAGRVLRIERRGGQWVVVTSDGVIAGAPGAF